ncbi:PEP-CTERM sorting domain-containing protein [Undibacterium terreum]|uniref:PEP-CTERM protein-sorting domain-containing protein n=1 Tax=Undibacterium terreum TaxID=1224302 RepID=A0A916UGC0_9BURK|nr:PEP-CTERM sorting domain-containing protein [Undibacterium terreum]GGC69872.1 hypothetical protein GCM10011396_16130 [Undibacterium terreum]
MKFTSIFGKLAAAAAFAMSLATANSYATPAFTLDPYSIVNDDTNNYNFAVEFTANQAITVNALAYFFSDANTSGSHAVALFDMSGNKLAETIVDVSDILLGSFRYSSIDAVNLLAGASYRIVGLSNGESYGLSAQNISVNSAISYIQSGFSDITDSAAPEFTTMTWGEKGQPTDSIWGPSLSFNLTQANVPEPATYALFAAGLGLLLISRRRKSS